jgi:hypothetical protein
MAAPVTNERLRDASTMRLRSVKEIRQGKVVLDVDYQQLLNTVHVPEDAGEHAEALRGILLRIPYGWGRWISCDRGWYPLLVELDEQLRMLLPNYVLHQVKEKFGGLRYYWESGEDVHDPKDPEPPTPGRDGNEAERGQWSQQHDAWSERLDTYRQTPEAKARIADLQSRIKFGEKLIEAAERRASVTCELCGATGMLHRTPASGHWYKTLCPACAERDTYVPSGGSDAK